MALNGEAGCQAEVLRGGLHHSLWFWQYRIHKVYLVTVPQGKIGNVYAPAAATAVLTAPAAPASATH